MTADLAPAGRVRPASKDVIGTALVAVVLVLPFAAGGAEPLAWLGLAVALGLTGITVTKLDGSAKGGILPAIATQLGVPVRFIGIGETATDMQPFVADDYVDALLSVDDRSGKDLS